MHDMDLGKAEEELLNVRHIEAGQQRIVVVVITKPFLHSVISDPHSTVVSDVLSQRQQSVQLKSQHCHL